MFCTEVVSSEKWEFHPPEFAYLIKNIKAELLSLSIALVCACVCARNQKSRTYSLANQAQGSIFAAAIRAEKKNAKYGGYCLLCSVY